MFLLVVIFFFFSFIVQALFFFFVSFSHSYAFRRSVTLSRAEMWPMFLQISVNDANELRSNRTNANSNSGYANERMIRCACMHLSKQCCMHFLSKLLNASNVRELCDRCSSAPAHNEFAKQMHFATLL